jgi:hypothetical protein
MTLTEPATPTRLDRWSGACWVAAGVLLLTGVFHPDVFETTFADAALDTPLWGPIHAAAVVAAVLTLFGLTGLYARRAEQLGRLGAVGFALAVPGLVMAACIGYAEAFLLPVLARDTPRLFGWDGPVVTSWTIRVTAGLALLWLVGLFLLGLALWRSGVVPRGAALTLAASAVAWVLFAGPFVPVLGPLSTLALAAGYLGVGAALFTGATGHRDPTEPSRQRRHGSGRTHA